jgi:uncharacterized LabA/DUF88 family protein
MDENNTALYTKLQSIGYILIFKPMLTQKGVKKGNCDTELVLHSMIQYPEYDEAVIVTGDINYKCLPLQGLTLYSLEFLD